VETENYLNSVISVQSNPHSQQPRPSKFCLIKN